MKLIVAGESTASRRRVFFQLVDATDGITAETGETGGQPQIAINGDIVTGSDRWVGTGYIGTLTHIGNGRYYAELDSQTVATAGTQIETRYKSANTAECPGDSVQVVAFNPNDSVRLGLTALPNAAAEASGGLITRGTGTGQISLSSGAVTVGTNNDKTGYSLSQSFPANFSSLAITAGGAVTAGTVSDKTGYSLTQSFPSNFASLAITGGGAVTAGTVSDKTGYSLATAPLTSADIADAVWDEVLSDHLTAGSTGNALNAAGSAGDPWSTALPGAYGAGTAGKIIGDNLNATVSSRLASSAITLSSGAVTVGTNNDKAGYSLTQSFPANFSSLAITAGGAVTAGTVSDKTGYSLTQSFPSNFASLAITAGGIVSANTTQLAGQTVSASAGVTFPSSVGTSTLTAANVWDTNISGYTTAGYAGTYLKGAGAAGDPWSAALPGSYGAGTAGKIIGDNINATISSRLASSAITLSSGAVTVGTNNDKTGYSLSSSQTFNVTGNITGNLSGSVGSVTGAVGSVTNAVTVGTINNDVITAASISADAGAEIADAVWDEATSGHTTAGTYGGRVLRSQNSNVEVKVVGSGSGHVAADVHAFQADVIDSAALANSAGDDIADRILGRNIAGGSSSGRIVKDALRFLRNRFAVSAGTLTVYAEDDTTPAWTATVTGDAASTPIVESNPA